MKPLERKRLDHALVERGLAPTRSKAQQLIDAGEVEIFVRGRWLTAEQASQPAPEQIRIRSDAQTLKFVSRGGLKLEGALNHLGLDVTGWRCLDIGLSTGGFTDCLLQRGAASVCGLDVGHGQLHERLKTDSRLMAFDGVNVKDLSQHSGIGSFLGAGVDLCVVDLSFISLIAALPTFAPALPRAIRLLALVKPQFEVGAENLDKKGIVRDENLFDPIRGRVFNAFEQFGFTVHDYFSSQIKGQDGNQEFFVFSSRS